MKKLAYTSQFKRDLDKAKKSGRDIEIFKKLAKLIVAGKVLPDLFRDHKLSGKFKGRRECHITPDWLLIYKSEKDKVTFERMGSHSELFK